MYNQENSNCVANNVNSATKKKKGVWRKVKKTVRRSLGGGNKKQTPELANMTYSEQTRVNYTPERSSTPGELSRSNSSGVYSVDDLIKQQQVARSKAVMSSSITRRPFDANDSPDKFAIRSMTPASQAAGKKKKKIYFWKKKKRNRYATSADLENLGQILATANSNNSNSRQYHQRSHSTGTGHAVPASVAGQPRFQHQPSHDFHHRATHSVDSYRNKHQHPPTSCGAAPPSAPSPKYEEEHKLRAAKSKAMEADRELHQWEMEKGQRTESDEEIALALRESMDQAEIFDEELRRFEMEKKNSARMTIEAELERIEGLLQICDMRDNIWKKAPAGSEERKFTFWGKKSLGFKVKLKGDYPHVHHVEPGAQAEEKGLQVQDRIIGINNNMLPKQKSYDSFCDMLRCAKRPFVINVIRAPSETQFNCNNGGIDRPFSIQCSLAPGGSDDIGFELADENFAQYVVKNVDAGSTVQHGGLQAGDVLCGINGTPFHDGIAIDDVMHIICNHMHSGQVFSLDFVREPSQQVYAPPFTPSHARPNKCALKTSTRFQARDSRKKNVEFREGKEEREVFSDSKPPQQQHMQQHMQQQQQQQQHMQQQQQQQYMQQQQHTQQQQQQHMQQHQQHQQQIPQVRQPHQQFRQPQHSY